MNAHLLGVGRRIVGVVLAAALLAGCGSTLPATSHFPAASAGPTPAASGITRDRAIAIAREASPRYATADVLRAEMGPFGDLVSAFTAQHFSPVPTSDRLVWKVTLGEQPSPTGGQGTDVIIDFWDGRVILATEWFS
jgi:hypothetical protein